MKVNITGIQLNTVCCTGSGGVGFNRICSHMVTPMMSGQTPSMRICGGVQGMRPNRLNTVVGSGAERSRIQPKKGAWRISMVTNSTLYSAKNTGIWITTATQPDTGLI